MNNIVSRRTWKVRIEKKLRRIAKRSAGWRVHVTGLVSLCMGYLYCCGSIPTVEDARTMASELLKNI